MCFITSYCQLYYTLLLRNILITDNDKKLTTYFHFENPIIVKKELTMDWWLAAHQPEPEVGV
jgi:hypothetical protein